MLLFKLVERSLGIVSTIILARLLVPGDFGLVAMATAVVAMLELFSNFNFDVVLIREASVERRHFDTAWTFTVVIGTSIAVLLLALAPVMATFYSEPRLQAVISALAIAAFVQGFENIGVVAFRREMHFHKDFLFMIGKKFAGFCVTIPLAFLLRSYWALVAGIIASRVTGITLSYYAHPYRPRLSLAARQELLHFSKWLLASNIANFGRERAPDFIIGRVAGAHSLGLYNIAQEIVSLPTTELVAPVNRAAYPAYARLAGDVSRLRYTYLQVVSMVGLLALPAAIGLGLTADLFVPILLGPSWLESAGLMQILAVAGAIGALQSSSWSVCIALGKPRTLTYLGLTSLAVMVPLLMTLASWRGAEGAAWGYLALMSLLVIVTYALLLRDLTLRLSELMRVFWRPLVAIGAMTAIVLSLEAQWPEPSELTFQALRLGLVISAGAGAYSVTVLVLWLLAGRPDGAERLAMKKLWPMVRAHLPLQWTPKA
jgi:O-antigen/teichoic acid export membrane protein